MGKKILCNSLYKDLIYEKYYEDILFLNNEECETKGEGIDISEIEMAIYQPFYANKQFLNKMPKLKYVQITGAGYDRVDIEELRKREITLCNSGGVMSVSIAEDVFAKMMFFSRKIRTVEDDKVKHKWNLFNQDQWMCSCYEDLYGKNIGILGYGSIGREIAKRASAFGMNVNVFSEHKHKDEYINQCYTRDEDRSYFYESSDYLIIAVPLNDKTKYMISTKQFKLMKNSAILINIARGPIVDTRALQQALKNQEIRGAALDVFEEEPLSKDSSLWQENNLYISSHKAGMGDSWKRFIGDLIMRNIDNYKSGNLMENKITI